MVQYRCLRDESRRNVWDRRCRFPAGTRFLEFGFWGDQEIQNYGVQRARVARPVLQLVQSPQPRKSVVNADFSDFRTNYVHPIESSGDRVCSEIHVLALESGRRETGRWTVILGCELIGQYGIQWASCAGTLF